jgi:hypothetical protein
MISKFGFLGSIKQVDEALERGFGYKPASPPHGKYDIGSLAAMLMAYQVKHMDERGPLEISIADSRCDPIDLYSFYHKTPWTDQERKELESRRRELENVEEQRDINAIKHYKHVVERRGTDWLIDTVNKLETEAQNAGTSTK